MKTTYAAAVRAALADEMARDGTVWALGQDLGRGEALDGVEAYTGLVDRFGPQRIVDTPISEAAMVGAAVGSAIAGTRPVVDLRAVDFALCAIDEIVNHVAKLPAIAAGRIRVPIVVRQALGYRSGAGPQHGQSLEAWFVHVPGLIVVAPATPDDARGLLKQSIRSDQPVVFFEHKALWRVEGEVDPAGPMIPFGVCRRVHPGDDLTMVTWSATVHLAERAAQLLATEGIGVDLLDLRSLWPWDVDGVLASVRRTGRLLVVHEAVETGGFGAEVAATVGDRAFAALRAPVRRLGARREVLPYAPDRALALLPTLESIAAAARQLVEYDGGPTAT